DHLQAAVLTVAWIDGDEGAGEQRGQHAVLVPVAVVLVPGPRAADLGVLEDHLRVVMVDLAVEDLLATSHDPFAAGEHAVDAVAGVVPERQSDHAALAVGAAEGTAIELVVFLGGAAEQRNFLGVEEAAGEVKAV